MKDITIEEAVKDLKSLIEEYKDCSVEGLNMQVDVGFDEERCRNLEKVLNELEKTEEELKHQKHQIKEIQEEFLKYNWKTTKPDCMYNQVKSLYESIFGEVKDE